MEAKRVFFEKDLPDHLRHLVDSSKPLASGVQFFEGPPATRKGAAVWIGLAILSAIAAVAMIALSLKTRAGAYESGQNSFSKSLFSGGIVAALLTLGWVWKAWLDLKRAKATEQGSADRQGLFLTPDLLLIWSDVSRLFPREKVVSFKSDPIVKDGVTFLNTELTFTTDKGEQDTIGHIEDCLDDDRRQEAVKAMQAWAAK